MPVSTEKLQEIFRLLIQLSAMALAEAKAAQAIILTKHPELAPLLEQARSEIRKQLPSLDNPEQSIDQALLALLRDFDGTVQ